MNISNEVLTILSCEKNHKNDKLQNENTSNRYVHAIHNLLRKENPQKVNQFIQLYVDLISNLEIELFKVHVVIYLFHKWMSYNLIFEDIKWINKKIGNKKVDIVFWEIFIENVLNDKASRQTQLTRINLLINAIKYVKFKKDEFTTYGIVIRTILKLNICLNDQLLLWRTFDKSNNEYYKSMFFIIRLLINKKIDPLTLSEIIHNHFYISEKRYGYNNHSKEFFQLLTEKLPADYLIHISRIDLKKLFFLFNQRAILFKELNYNQSKIPNLENIIDELFQTFMISRVFLHGFIKDKIKEHELKWFILELNGKNIVYAEDLPFKLTKKGAHFFRTMQEDVGLTVTQSLIYAEVHVLTDNKSMAMAIANCIRNLNHTNFWIDTMTNFHKKGLDSGDVLEVMDYINAVIFEEGKMIDFKNKKLENLYRDIEQWHENLSSTKFLENSKIKRLPNSFIPEYKLEYNDINYRIFQLKKNDELYFEGQTLGHCVFTYLNYCLQRKSYIFSLRCIHKTKEKTLITIEVDDTKQIRQAKGKYNRPATSIEKFIIKNWAETNDLSVNF